MSHRLRSELPAALALILALGCGAEEAPRPDAGHPPVSAFTGATVIDGSGGPPLPNATILVRDGRFADVGPAGDVPVPEDADVTDLTGTFVAPGLINAHGHVGGTVGLESGHYSRENVLRQLGRYARYGVTTVLSLGDDEGAGVQVRGEQRTSALDRARLFLAGTVVTGDSVPAALEVVNANAGMGVDFIKIRVDDNLGTTEKMPPEIYRAVIERAHQLELPVAAHVYYLEDAKALLEAGVDLIAHSVRDRAVDEAFATALIDNQVCYVPTLTRELSTFVYGDVPDFFQDPFFLAEADPNVLRRLRDPGRMAEVRESESARLYREALERGKRNLGILAEAGVTIALGTDSGPPGRFQGYFEHLELELMAEAGLSPEEILVAATSGAARCIGHRDDLGVIQPGAWADFVVLGADPLLSVRNWRRIESVWIAGNPVGAPGEPATQEP